VRKGEEKSLRPPFRLPIDRVFSVDGFGTVVTGTLIEGAVNVGDPVEVMPEGLEARVRNLQVHGKDVDTAFAGQRVAVNLAGIKKAELDRGDTVAWPKSVRTTRMLDVRLRNVKNSQRTILAGSQVHLYHGSSVRLAKVVLLDREALQPGESCYAQLRMTEDLAAKPGDRFVIRFYSPLETIGGGVILDDNPRRHKAGDQGVLDALAIKESGSGDQRLIQAVAEGGSSLPALDKLAVQLNMDKEELGQALGGLCAAGKLLEPLPGRYLALSVLDGLWESCSALLEQYHKQNPLHAGMKVAELRQKLLKAADQAVADAILAALVREGKLKRVAGRYALADFSVHLTKRQNSIKDRLLKQYGGYGLETPGLDEVYGGFESKELTDCKQVVESLVSSGELVMLTPQICVHQDVYRDVCRKLCAYLAGHETIALADFRDLMGTSRKYALAVLEYYDKNKILKKEEDLRRPGMNFRDISQYFDEVSENG